MTEAARSSGNRAEYCSRSFHLAEGGIPEARARRRLKQLTAVPPGSRLAGAPSTSSTALALEIDRGPREQGLALVVVIGHTTEGIDAPSVRTQAGMRRRGTKPDARFRNRQ